MAGGLGCARDYKSEAAHRILYHRAISLTIMIEKKIFILLCLLSASLCASLDHQWHSWKATHSKSYGDDSEEDARRIVWYDNYKKIVDHNNANRSYTLALNEFADLVRIQYCLWL